MALFNIPNRSGRARDLDIAKKSKSKVKTGGVSIKGGKGLIDKINEIKAFVEANLGQYKDEYVLIQDEQQLVDYIDACIDNKYISIDTETDGLDPLIDRIAGICIYTYGQKSAYIPINHESYITHQKLDGQLSERIIIEQFKRLLKVNPFIEMFNAQFDIRVLRHMGIKDIYCTWDVALAAHILNDNEPTYKLKPLHKKYCLQGKGNAFTFDELFESIKFTMIPYNVGYLYAAHDPIITTELGDYQRKYLRLDSPREDIRNMAWVFHNIEMPCVSVVADMEDIGVAFDFDYQRELSPKYNKMLEEKKEQFYKQCAKYKDKIEAYKKKNPEHKLDDPINPGSPTQLAILLYDILKLKSPDKRNARGTGKEILEKIDNPVAKAVLEWRKFAKLVSTYVDKLPECVNPNDGRIHCSFWQYGAVTGRFASSEPNLQNIPSHDKYIRRMFKATDYDKTLTTENDEFLVKTWDEVETDTGFKIAHKLKKGDRLRCAETDDFYNVTALTVEGNDIRIIVK